MPGADGAGSVGRHQLPRPPSGCAVAAYSAGPSVAGPDAQPPLHALGKDDDGRAGTAFSRRLRIAARLTRRAGGEHRGRRLIKVAYEALRT